MSSSTLSLNKLHGGKRERKEKMKKSCHFESEVGLFFPQDELLDLKTLHYCTFMLPR